MIRLASWNVNSLTVRLQQVLLWLKATNIDILAMQEIKIIDEKFPVNIFTELGYHVMVAGQKRYNGVAIVSRYPMQDILTDLPTVHDPQRRILAATVADIRLINLYVPNGEAILSNKYQYKLMWLDNIMAFIKQQLLTYPKLVVAGDFNIAPADNDVHNPDECKDQLMLSTAERKAFVDLLALGLNDSYRNFAPKERAFTWWDYRANAFKRNRGFRIDHILISHALNSLCSLSKIDKIPRGWQRPSDHAPIWIELNQDI